MSSGFSLCFARNAVWKVTRLGKSLVVRTDQQLRTSRPTPRGANTVERALTVVAEILDRGGEAALRLADVSRRSSVSVGSLYHHFGSREGLVNAARERQFRLSLPRESADEIAYLGGSNSPTEFLQRFDELLRASDTPERDAGRRRRFEMIGAAASRPGHLGGIVTLQTSYLDQWEGLVRSLQERGWIRTDAPPRAIALFMHSCSMSRVLRELDEDPVDAQVWRNMLCQTVACFVAEEAMRKAS